MDRVVYATIGDFQSRIIHHVGRGFLRRDVDISGLICLRHVVIGHDGAGVIVVGFGRSILSIKLSDARRLLVENHLAIGVGIGCRRWALILHLNLRSFAR